MLILAAILLVLLSGFHSILGEKLILKPTHKKDALPKIWGSRQATYRTIQATWHLVSILWLGLAAFLLAIEFSTANLAQTFLVIFGVIFAALTILPLIWSAGKHKSWIAFGLIAILLLWKASVI